MVYVPHVCWVLMRYMLYRTNIFDMLIYFFDTHQDNFDTFTQHIETAFGSGKVEILYRNITGTMTYGFKWMSVWHNRMWHNVLQAIKLCCGGKAYVGQLFHPVPQVHFTSLLWSLAVLISLSCAKIKDVKPHFIHPSFPCGFTIELHIKTLSKL